jgi:hypothetical protein
MIRCFALLLLLLAAQWSWGARVYKCQNDSGTIYSFTYCGASQEVLNPYVPPANNGVKQKTIESLCLGVILKKFRFKDPASARVEGSETLWLTDDSGPRHVMMLSVNAKNGFGGYAGAKPYPCFLSTDGQRLSNIQELVN